jgi:O-antigen/teichoic acid export membrane protein
LASRIGAVTLVVGLGLCVQAAGYATARRGSVNFGLDLFFVGVVVIFAPCAWRLLGRAAERTERLQVVALLAVVLAASFCLASPLIFDTFDEMLHDATLWQFLDLRRLFGANTELPISPYYPGLEMLTVALRWGSGLPTVVCQTLVVLMCRFVLVMAFFLFCERVLHSARAAGFAVLVYACGPQFYAFNAAYSYQTIAIAFGAAAVYFLLLAGDGVHTRRWTIVSVLAIVGAAVSHHLVSGLTVGLLVAWAFVISIESRRRTELRARAAVVRRVAGLGVVIVSAWTAFATRHLITYLKPIFVQAWQSLESVLLGNSGPRTLFQAANGVPTPLWQKALLVLSIAVTCILGLVVAWRAIFTRSLRRGFQGILPIIVTAGYVLVLLSPLAAGSSQIGQRASTFVYFGLGILGGAWYLTWKRTPPLVLLTALASACFLGSLIFGSGPSWTYVPGPYIPAGDQRAVVPPNIAAAQWAAIHLAVDSHLASDIDNSVLLAAVGHLEAISEGSGQLNPGTIFFSEYFGTYDAEVIKQFDIRYIVVDRQLLEGPPAFGDYFDPGSPSPGEVNRVTAADLNKFGTAPGLRVIYDNGPIQIYDTGTLLGTTKPATTLAPFDDLQNRLNLWVFVPAMLAILSWLVRARRKRHVPREEEFLGGLVAAMALAIIAMFGVVPSRLDPTPIAATLLVAVALLAWRDDAIALLRGATPAPSPGVDERRTVAPDELKRELVVPEPTSPWIPAVTNGGAPHSGDSVGVGAVTSGWRTVANREYVSTLLLGHGLFGRFGYLLATQFSTVLIGVGYWALSARSIAASQVGVAAAAMSAATLLSALGVLGANTVIIVEAKNQRSIDQRAFITTGLAVVAPVVAALTLGLWAISPLLGASLRTIGHSPADALLMVLGAVLTLAASIADAVGLGLSKSRTRLTRNILSSVLKVAGVGVAVALGKRTTVALLIGWNASLFLSLLTYPMLRLERVRVSMARRREIVRSYWRLALGHHAVNLALGFMGFLLPAVAAIFVAPKEVAYFAVAQLIASNAVALPYLLSMSLFVESAGDPELLRRNVRKTFPTGVICSLAALVIVEPLAHVVLGVFGQTYAEHGTTCLRLLLFAGLPYVVKDHFVAIRRAQNRLTEAAKLGIASTAFEVAAASLGAALGGLNWLCAAWVLAAATEALFFLPAVLNVMRARVHSQQRRSRAELFLGTSGALACLLAVAIAVVSARTYFEPVTALSLVNSPNQAPIVEVSLASPPGAAKLELVDGGEVLSTYDLRRVPSQTVSLPSSAATNGDEIELLINGKVTRQITA